MTEKTAAQAPPNPLQLQSARELRQPDRDGQLSHLFTTLSPDIPLAELALDDILEVNWNAVKTSIHDAVVRVRHEGDLTSVTVRDTIRLVALALKKLGSAGADLERRIESRPGLGFWGWFLWLWPTEAGSRLRAVVRDRRRMKAQRRQLDAHREEIFRMRIEMAREIDRKTGMALAAKDPEYHASLLRLQSSQSDRSTAKRILSDLESLTELEIERAGCNQMNSSDLHRGTLDLKMRQIQDKMRSFIEFCRRAGGEHVKDRGDVELFAAELAARLDAQATPIEQVMAAKREAMKRELYAEAADADP